MKHVKVWDHTSLAANLSNWIAPLGPGGNSEFGLFDATTPPFEARAVCTVEGTLSNLAVDMAAAPGSGFTWTWLVFHKPFGGAWASTSITVAIADPATSGNSGSASLAVGVGDELSIRAQASDASAAEPKSHVNIDFDSANTGQTPYSMAGANNLSNSAVRYISLFPNGLHQSRSALTGSNNENLITVIPLSGAISRWDIQLENAPTGLASFTFAIYKNGVKQDGSGDTVNTLVTISGTNVRAVGTFSLTLTPADTVYVEITPASTPVVGPCIFGVRLVAVTEGESIHFLDQTGSVATSSGATQFKGYEHNVGWNVTEPDVENKVLVTAFSLKHLHINLSAAPGSGDTRTFSLRRNTASPSGTPSVAITGASQVEGSDTAALSFVAGDFLAVRMVNSANGVVDSAHARLSFIQFIGEGSDPIVQTLPATGIQTTQGRIRGQLDPEGIAYSGYFFWGTDPNTLSNITAFIVVGSGDVFVPFDVILTGLLPSTTYYFQAWGDAGTSPDIFGEILSFTTLGEQAFIDGEVSHPLTWIHLQRRDGVTKTYAEVDLNDAPDYYHGYKAPLVERFHTVSRGLSDRDGQIEHFTFGATFSDTAYTFRELFDDPVNQFLTNRPLIEMMIDDEQRRMEGLARYLAVGFLTDYSPKPDLRFDVIGSDWLKKKFSRKVKAQQSWQPLITEAHFPNCEEEHLNIAAPIIYGALGLTGADPVLNVRMTVNAQPAAAPTSFAVALQAGGQYAGVTKHYKIAAIVDGQESIQAGILIATTTAANRTVRLTWDAYPGTGVTAIYVYASHRADFAQFIFTVLDPSEMSFDDEWTPIKTAQDDTWGPWDLGLRLNLTYYVYAALGGGVYSLPGSVTGFIAPLPLDQALQDRDIDVDWDSHALAVDGYRAIRRRSYYSDWNPVFDRQWDVPASGSPEVLSVTDDVVTTTEVSIPDGELLAASAAGQVEAIPVGTMSFGSPAAQILNVLLVARHACKRVGTVYVPVEVENVDGETETVYEPVPESAFGNTWFAPDHANWLYATKYVDIGGTWYTLIATTLSPLPEKVLVDVDGIEADGDGEGELITSLVLQRLHFMNNFIAPDPPWTNGPYLTAADTTFPHLPTLPLVDEPSHLNVQAQLDARLVGGYVGATIIGAGGEFISALDALARFQMSGDFDQVFTRKGQDSITCEPIETTPDLPDVSDVINIEASTLTITDQVLSAFFNILPFVHTRDYTGRTLSGWYVSGDVRSQESIDNYEQERESPRFDLHCLRANSAQGLATIQDVMARKLARYQDPRRVGTLTMGFEGLNYEPGRVVALTTAEGVGASGWAGREIRFTHHDVNPSEGRVILDFYDLTQVLENQEAASP